ncbi:MAG TPA: Ldh family oxidoreductase, partial [bacterium]|nr:Ldh family oxidoreductase [bacterium]
GLMAGNRYEPGRELRESFALMLINPAAFGEADFYSKEVNRFVEIIKGGRRRPGVKEIRLPGERSFRSLARSEGLGIFLSGETLARLNDLAARNGLKPISLKS